MIAHMKLALACVLLVACGGGGTNEGAFLFSWVITDNGQPVDCTAGGISTILIVTDDGTQLTTEQFLCVDDEATTGPRAPGTYTIDVSALDDQDGVVATSTDQATALAGEIVDVGVFPLEIAAEVCDSSTCPTGCCDDTGVCVDPQSDAACGRSGVSCTDCTGLGQVCNTTEGLCID